MYKEVDIFRVKGLLKPFISLKQALTHLYAVLHELME
jgi:hypothetical protein